MADQVSHTPDNIENVLYVSQEDLFGVECEFRGFKKIYLLNNLTEMEEELIICPTCDGLIRDASTYEGEMTCTLCSQNENNAKPVNKVRTLVAKLGIKCPLLRDCDWTGSLSEAETHLSFCGSALVFCPLGCEVVVKRCEVDEHATNECSLRKIECEFCEKIFPFGDIESHLDICPDHPIKCDCEVELPRSKMDVHIETECPLAEVECPYAIYSCSFGKMLRKDILAHKKTYFIEHQDMLQSMFEAENYRLKESLMRKKDLDGFEWKINDFQCLSSDSEMDDFEGPPFYIGNCEFICVLRPGDPLILKIKKSEKSVHSKDKIEICLTESRLILEKSPKMNEPFFRVKKSKNRLSIAKTSETLFSLESAIYTKYIQSDNSLCIRMYFDFAFKIRKKEKYHQIINGKD